MALVAFTGVSQETAPSTKSPTMLLLGTAILRTSAATTSSYVATGHIYVAQAALVTLKFVLTWVDSTSTQWIIDWSPDGTTFYSDTNTAASAGTNTLTVATQTFVIGASTNWIHTVTPKDLYMRIQAKKTGGAGADALGVTATLIGA